MQEAKIRNRSININILSIILASLFLIGCSGPKYILRTDTPPINEGFLGFKWKSPMGVVDRELSSRSGVNKIHGKYEYNKYFFSGINFLGEQTSECQFNFKDQGLYSVRIIFNPQKKNIHLVEKLKREMTKFYGNPSEHRGNDIINQDYDYYKKFTWDGQKLILYLKKNFYIIIEAYEYRSTVRYRNND